MVCIGRYPRRSHQVLFQGALESTGGERGHTMTGSIRRILETVFGIHPSNDDVRLIRCTVVAKSIHLTFAMDHSHSLEVVQTVEEARGEISESIVVEVTVELFR